MAKLSGEIKELINIIPESDFTKLLVKAASEYKSFHDYLLLTYFDKESVEKDLYKEAVNDIHHLFFKRYKGFSFQLQVANCTAACSKRIKEFTKLCKNKKLEADLLVYTLNQVCSDPNCFQTCFTACDYRVGLLVDRLIKIVNNELHEDHQIEYRENINNYRIIMKGNY
ncbi:MAG: hypothetical protein V1773_19560 [bacterium]